MNPLNDKFTQFGQAISQCSDLLVELVNLGGEEAYFDKTPPKFHVLSNLDIVLGNVADGYSASSILMELSRALAKQETTKRLAPDVDEWLAQINLRINQLNNALAENNNDNYVNRLSEIKELVLVMREGLTNEMRNLEFSINTKFGDVKSIQDKQSENKYLIDRVSRLANKLMLLDFKKLRSMAGDNPNLLALLPSRLHDSIEHCRSSLFNALPRLRHLLWEFEKINKNSQLVWAMHHHLRNQSIAYTHIPSESELEPLKLCPQDNQKEAKTHPDICNERYRDDIADIIHSMKPRPESLTIEQKTEVTETELSETSPNESAILESYMEDKLLEMVLLSQVSKISCITFWEKHVTGQEHPSGYMQWSHKMLLSMPGITVKKLLVPCSEWSGNENIYDFTLEFNDAA